MTTKTQANVIQFLQELQKWIDDGMPEDLIFLRYSALCGTLYRWGKYYANMSNREVLDHRQYLKSLWYDPRKIQPDWYPFNEDDDYYCQEVDTDTIYFNILRLEFIKKFSNPANHPKFGEVTK